MGLRALGGLSNPVIRENNIRLYGLQEEGTGLRNPVIRGENIRPSVEGTGLRNPVIGGGAAIPRVQVAISLQPPIYT